MPRKKCTATLVGGPRDGERVEVVGTHYECCELLPLKLPSCGPRAKIVKQPDLPFPFCLSPKRKRITHRYEWEWDLDGKKWLGVYKGAFNEKGNRVRVKKND